MTKGYLIKIVVSLTMMLTALTAQENVDAIEKARQAKEAADKAAAEAAAVVATTSTMVNDGPPLLSNEDAEARDKNFVRVVYQCLLPRRRSFDPGNGSLMAL